MVNLSQLDIIKSAGWSGLYVMDINDHGQMTGYGFISGAIHAFLLTRPDGDEFFNNYVDTRDDTGTTNLRDATGGVRINLF